MLKIIKLTTFPKLPILSFVASVIAALILLWLSQLATDELVESRLLVERTYNVVSRLEELHGNVEQIESSRRGFLIARQEQYLRPYQHAQKHVFKDLAALKELTTENPAQQERLAELEPLLKELVALVKQDINTRTSDDALTAERMARAKVLIDQSRLLIDQLSAEEGLLLREHIKDSEIKSHNLRLWLIGISLAFVLLLAIAFYYSQHEIAHRRRAEQNLLKSKAQNEATVHNLSLIGEMTSLLQACSDTDESLDVICQYAERLLPVDSGALYMFRETGNQLEMAVHWGIESKSEVVFAPEDCWALRRGEMHILDGEDHALACRHLHDWKETSSLCVPIVAQGNVLGILHLENHGQKSIGGTERSLANNLATQIALAMASVRLRDTLRNLSVRDPLTGLFNRRYMEESLQREIATAQRKNRSLAIVIFDLDYFKKFNDTFGHETGDFLLREVGNLLSRKSRIGDIACRFGGEEFVMIYPEAPPEIAIQLANQLREAIAALKLQHFGKPLGQVSASFGLAFYPVHGNTGDELLRAADKALYEAKAAGRNRVEIAKG